MHPGEGHGVHCPQYLIMSLITYAFKIHSSPHTWFTQRPAVQLGLDFLAGASLLLTYDTRSDSQQAWELTAPSLLPDWRWSCIYFPVTSLSGTHQDTLTFTIKKIRVQMFSRPPQQMVTWRQPGVNEEMVMKSRSAAVVWREVRSVEPRGQLMCLLGFHGPSWAIHLVDNKPSPNNGWGSS